MEHKPHYHHQV